MEAAPVNYDSLNGVVITVDFTQRSQSGNIVSSITRRFLREEKWIHG